MSERGAVITFRDGWADSHQASPDGMPIYTEQVLIRILDTPLLDIERVATQAEMREHKDAYDAYLATRKAQRNIDDSGYPLMYWPAASAAEVQMLAVRKITTVEQLAEYAGDDSLPGQLADLALRAERMIDMQKSFGKYEVIMREYEGEIEVLKGQLTELKQSLSAANAIIETLKMRVT